MADRILRKYGVQTVVNFELYKADGTALKTDAVSASGDIKIMKDEGPETTLNCDAFYDEGQGYSTIVSATELTAARVVLYIVDQTSPQTWLDKVVIIETYGNASAQHPFDLATATQSVTVSDKTGFSLSAAGIDGVLDEVVENTLTLRQAVMLIKAACAGKSSGGGTVTVTFRDDADTKNRISATVDTNGNRTAVTTNVT